MTLSLQFYNQLQRIDLAYALILIASVGSFYLDETKLRVQFPLAVQGTISHDIPFGVVDTIQERPIHPNSWVDISDGEKGLAYFHKGTFKHWVKEDTLVNLLAWGEETDAIGSRMWRVNWAKCFDQRLDGKHVIETALYPHSGNWREAEIPAAAQSFGTPLFTLQAEQHQGSLPSELNILHLAQSELSATVVKVEDQELICRLVSLAEQPVTAAIESEKLNVSTMQTLAGETISDIKPFQIAVLQLNPK